MTRIQEPALAGFLRGVTNEADGQGSLIRSDDPAQMDVSLWSEHSFLPSPFLLFLSLLPPIFIFSSPLCPIRAPRLLVDRKSKIAREGTNCLLLDWESKLAQCMSLPHGPQTESPC